MPLEAFLNKSAFPAVLCMMSPLSWERLPISRGGAGLGVLLGNAAVWTCQQGAAFTALRGGTKSVSHFSSSRMSIFNVSWGFWPSCIQFQQREPGVFPSPGLGGHGCGRAASRGRPSWCETEQSQDVGSGWVTLRVLLPTSLLLPSSHPLGLSPAVLGLWGWRPRRPAATPGPWGLHCHHADGFHGLRHVVWLLPSQGI